MGVYGAATAILVGGLVFAGPARGAFLQIVEDFESATQTGGGAAGAFFGGTGGGFGAYNSADNYSGSSHAAALGGAGGAYYGHTIDVDSPVVSDAFDIPPGFLSIYTEAWLASWTGDSDYTVISLAFYSDSPGTVALGAPAVALDGSVSNGDPGWTQDNWSFYQNNIPVPAGAVSLRVLLGGVGNDTYADNIVVGVPEPGTLAMLGSGALGVLRRRRRG